jgi:PAS domain S-box-containing protein
MEDSINKLHPGLPTLNKLAVRFNDIQSGQELYTDIARQLKILTGGMTATVSIYYPSDKCLHVKHAEVDHNVVNDLFMVLGRRRVTEVGFPITGKLYQQMEEFPIWYYYTLHEATFGVIPRHAGALLQRIQNVDRFLGIAFFFNQELYGASMVALRKNVPNPTTELIESFAHIAAMALRRVKAEEQLRKSEEKYRNIFNNAVEGIFQATPQGRLLTINPAFAQMFGYNSPAELMQNLTPERNHLFADPNDREKLMALLLTPEGLVRNFEMRVVDRNGSSIWVEINARAIRADEGSPGIIEGTCMEITDRKKAEEKIRKLNEELESRVLQRTQQLETANKELDAFSYSVSHDLRAPLRALNGFARMLEEDYAPLLDKEGKRMLSVISENANKMGRLIDDLLAFSRLGRQELTNEPVDMREMAQSVFTELCSGEDTGKIKFQLDKIPNAHGDPALLRQVWMNLIGNAIKYSSHKADPVIEIGFLSSETARCYYVRDNGAGFEMAYSNKLFGVFQRLHSVRDFEGVGVGLAIVKRIILRLNGRVWAEGDVGKGATFYFALPEE